MKYFIPFYLMYFAIIDDICCFHSHHHRIYRKRSELPETQTGKLPDQEDKERLKESLQLLNLGKQALDLKTESSELLMQLVQDSSHKVNPGRVEQILQQPDSRKDFGKEYLVLSGDDKQLRVENFTRVTAKPNAGKTGRNVEDFFKMELEKREPVGKQNVSHRITIIETNRQVPIQDGNLPPMRKRSRRNEMLFRLRRFHEPHDRQKRGKVESLVLIFPPRRGGKFGGQRNRKEDLEDGDHFKNNDNSDSDMGIRDTSPLDGSGSLSANYQRQLYFGDQNSPQAKLKFRDGVMNTVSREFHRKFRGTENLSSRQPFFRPSLKETFNVGRLLVHHTWPLYRKIILKEPTHRNDSHTDVGDIKDREPLKVALYNRPPARSTQSVMLTEQEFHAAKRNATTRSLKESVKSMYNIEELFGNSDGNLKSPLRHKLPVLPPIYQDQTAFQNQRVYPIRNEGIREILQTNILTITSTLTVALLCFITGLLCYSRLRYKDRDSYNGILNFQGKNVTVEVRDEDSANWGKRLWKRPFSDSGIETQCYKSLAVEDDCSSHLEWQSELGEWLSDLDDRRSH